MSKPLWAAFLAASMTVPAGAASLSLAGLVDGDGGSIVDLDGSIPLAENWIVGAGAGHGDSTVEGERFSGTSLRARTDVQFRSLFANADVERWKDSGQLRSTTWRVGAGWLGESGLAASLLVVDRSLEITYTALLAGNTSERQIKLEGNGFGAELGWFGEAWTAGASYVDYDYGRNVARIRAIRDAPATRRFPRLQQLITSVATRAAGAPDREMSLFIDRNLGRLHLGADWQQQRDAVTRDVIDSIGITVGMEFGSRFGIDLMAGGSRSDAADTVPWGGIALTLRSPARRAP